MKYLFKTKPYEHQIKALELGWNQREFGYFMEMGTGKTKVIIDTAAMLFDAGEIDALMVVAPKGVYRNWTKDGGELDLHMPQHIPLRVATWRASLTAGVKDAINRLFEPNDDLNIFAINIDAVITSKGSKVINKFLDTRRVLLVVDESTTIKSQKARRTKAMIQLGAKAKYRRILTGSPVTRSPLDVYTQCEFLNPRLLGYSSFYGFRGHFADTINQNFGGRTFKQKVGYKNLEELQDILKEFTYRVTKDECLDLPDKIYMRREFDLTKEQKKVYAEMKKFAMTELEGEDASVTNVIVQLLRLHQITCGHLTTDDREIREIKNDRLKELMEILEELNGRAIIWANYRHDIRRIYQAVVAEYGAESIVTYFCDTTDDERVRAVDKFQDRSSPVRWFLGNTQTGGYGITLTEASTVIYYSNNYDLEKRIQSEDRAHRIGQQRSVTYIDLVCRGTIDEKIINSLRNKNDIARQITGDQWREWL